MNTSCLEFIKTVRSGYPATSCLQLNFDGITVQLQTNERRLLGMLSEYFREFVADMDMDFSPMITITAHEAAVPRFEEEFIEKAPDPGKSRVKEEYLNCPDGRIVRKRLTKMILAFSGPENLAMGPCVANANQVINFINNRLIAYHLNKGGYLGHAAAVAYRGRGLALAGFSGMGKSTLALFLMNEGCIFVSNDRVILSADQPAVLHGVPKHPRINPGTAVNNPALRSIMTQEELKYFTSLPIEELWSLEHKYDALIDQCYGPYKFVLRSPFSGLVVLNWKMGEGETIVQEVDPFERLDLVEAFSKEAGLFYLPDEPEDYQPPTLMDYAQRLSKAPLIEISGSVNFNAAAKACMRFLK